MGQKTTRPFSSLFIHTNENAAWCNSYVTILWFTERQENTKKQCLPVYIHHPHKNWRNNSKGQLCKKSAVVRQALQLFTMVYRKFSPRTITQANHKEKVINFRDWKCCWVFSGWPIWVTEKLLHLQNFGWKGTQFLFYSQREGFSWDYACFLNRLEPFYKNKQKTNPQPKNIRKNSAFPCNHTTHFFGEFQVKRRVLALIKYTAHPRSYWLLQNL